MAVNFPFSCKQATIKKHAFLCLALTFLLGQNHSITTSTPLLQPPVEQFSAAASRCAVLGASSGEGIAAVAELVQL